MKPRILRPGGLALAALVAVLFGLASFGARNAEAVLLTQNGTCGQSPTNAPPSPSAPVNVGPAGPTTGQFECDLSTLPAAAGNIAATVTGGAVFNGGLAGTLAGCAVTVGLNTAAATITCAAPIAAGQAGLGMTGTATVTVSNITLVEPGPATSIALGIPYQFDGAGAGNTTPVTNVGEAAPNSPAACTNTTAGRAGLAILVGNTFSCVVTFPAGQTPSFVVPTFSGTGGATLTGTVASGRGPAQGYYCGTGAGNTPCASVTITGTATAPGTVAFTITAFALGAPAAYVTAAPVATTTPGGVGIQVLPTLTTTASGRVTISLPISDSATLAGGAAPTGTITFTAFGPNDPTCAAAPAFTSAAIPVAGNGVYLSGNFTPVLPGTYTFIASYSGDALNAPVTTACGAAGESVVVSDALPTVAAIGCANSNNNLDIRFPTQPGAGGFIVSGNQEPDPLGIVTTVNGSAQLSVLAPTAIQGLSTPQLDTVLCGALFQNDTAAGVSPNLIDGGTITFQLGGVTANGLTIAQILESNGASFSVSCGAATPGLPSCQGALTTDDVTGAPCVAATVDCDASPTASNTVHVGLRPGITFSLIGGFAPAISIQATYNRFAAYGAPFALSTNSTTIGLATPTYSLALTPSPASIPAALGSTTGSVITASLSRATSFQCVNVAGGFSGFVVCGLVGGIATPGIAVPLISFVNGAEPGVVTFSTTSGVFGLPGNPGASAQQIASVHCGSNPGTAPIFLVPFPGQPFSFSFSSCQTVSVTLYGGGAAGTAVVTGVYVGDYTGATATAGTTVALTASSPTVALSRGCNEVITGPTTAAAASATTILGLVSPSSAVVSIWQFNNSLHAFQALYFSTAGAPTDISSVGPNQSIFICVSGAATFTVV